MSSTNVERFRAAHQAFNRRDFDAIVNMMAEDFTYRDHARGITFNGRDGFREFMQAWVTALSNAEVHEPTYMDGGDVVVAEFIGQGINDGPLGPFAKTDKQLILDFCEMMRFNDEGQIVSGGIYYDQLSMMTQLGHAGHVEAAVAR